MDKSRAQMLWWSYVVPLLGLVLIPVLDYFDHTSLLLTSFLSLLVLMLTSVHLCPKRQLAWICAYIVLVVTVIHCPAFQPHYALGSLQGSYRSFVFIVLSFNTLWISHKHKVSQQAYEDIFKLLGMIHAPVLVSDMDGQILLSNNSALKFLGLQPEQIKQRTYFQLFSGPDNRGRFIEKYLSLFENSDGAPVGMELKFKDRITKIITTQCSTIQLNDRRVLLTELDIAGREQVNEQLQNTTRELFEAQQIAGVGSYIWDVKTGLWSGSETLDEVFGIEDPAFVKDTAGWLRLVHPQDRAEMQRYLSENILKNRAAFDRVYRIVRQNDQQERWVYGRGRLVEDHQGQVVQMMGVIQDITERKKLEAQFFRAQRMESIGNLAGGIAHDLNNILTPIMMSIDMLRDTATEAQEKNILDTIEVSAKRGADVVRQILSFTRGVEGKRVEIELKYIVRDLEKIVRDTFPRDIRFQCSVPSDTWQVLGDPTQIYQVLLNLCVNARDAMPDGGNLTVMVENSFLDEEYVAKNIQAKVGRHVKIGVADTGMGMAPEHLDRIFEPFFTTKELHKGTGLGLSTAMAIVRSHGGIINAHSKVGLGSTFNVYLPAADFATGVLRAETARLGLPRGKGETVLVIDDDVAILSMASSVLSVYGYKILTALDGAKGVDSYKEHRERIAVVLTDMAMPVMGGVATIKALKEINPALKIIAASGFSADADMTALTALGVDKFMAKPYETRDLLKVLAETLREV